MANSLFDFGRGEFLIGNHVWATDATRLSLIDEGTVTPSLTTHEDLADIVSAVVAESANFTYTDQTAGDLADGIADADAVTLSSVTGATVESICIYKETAVDATSSLLVYLDTVTPAFPFSPNTGDVTITWAGTANKIFKL